MSEATEARAFAIATSGLLLALIRELRDAGFLSEDQIGRALDTALAETERLPSDPGVQTARIVLEAMMSAALSPRSRPPTA